MREREREKERERGGGREIKQTEKANPADRADTRRIRICRDTNPTCFARKGYNVPFLNHSL